MSLAKACIIQQPAKHSLNYDFIYVNKNSSSGVIFTFFPLFDICCAAFTIFVTVYFYVVDFQNLSQSLDSDKG